MHYHNRLSRLRETVSGAMVLSRATNKLTPMKNPSLPSCNISKLSISFIRVGHGGSGHQRLDILAFAILRQYSQDSILRIFSRGSNDARDNIFYILICFESFQKLHHGYHVGFDIVVSKVITYLSSILIEKNFKLGF